jgi:hypothetical protein
MTNLLTALGRIMWRYLEVVIEGFVRLVRCVRSSAVLECLMFGLFERHWCCLDSRMLQKLIAFVSTGGAVREFDSLSKAGLCLSRSQIRCSERAGRQLGHTSAQSRHRCFVSEAR